MKVQETIQSWEKASSTGVGALPCSSPSTVHGPPSTDFPRCPGETPRAFAAFLAYFALGQTRSLQALAGQLGEKPNTLKRWSSRFAWSQRLQSFNSGLLQRQVSVQAAWAERQAADWARRDAEHREQQWAAAQKLLMAVDCFLESFGDAHVEKMNLAQVSRALDVSSRLARQALQGAPERDQPAVAPLQAELAAAIARAYGPAPVLPQSLARTSTVNQELGSSKPEPTTANPEA